MTKRKDGVRRTFHWTPETNATLIKMRNAQRNWDEISAAMECSVKSARYFDIACRRIEAAYRQADLFVAPPARVPVTPTADLFAGAAK